MPPKIQPNQSLQIGGFRCGRIGLTVSGRPTFDEWDSCGQVLRQIDGAVQWWVGDWLNYGERAYGEKYSQALEATDYDAGTLRNYAFVAQNIQLSRRRDNVSFSVHSEIAGLPTAKEQDLWLQRAADEQMTRAELRTAIRAEANARLSKTLPPLAKDKYRCLVVDPPWEVSKIEREVRPNQIAGTDAFEYPVMTDDELVAWPVVQDAAADDAHLYLWTTHRKLPIALQLVEQWGFTYQCVMTWAKNVGFTPFSWMYSTEHVLFCRRGNLSLDQLGMRLDFQAVVREHSRKPDEFYDLVRRASPGPRIDVFSREARDGFDQYGFETERFGAVSA